MTESFRNVSKLTISLPFLTALAAAKGHLNIIYSPFKLDLMINEKTWAACSRLLAEFFASGDVPGFEHTWGEFDPHEGFAYLDRAGYRLPDELFLRDGRQPGGGLALHVDWCAAMLASLPDLIFYALAVILGIWTERGTVQVNGVRCR